MNTKSTLEVRMTRKYHDGYAHLDEWKDVGTRRDLGIIRQRNDGESFRLSKLVSVQPFQGTTKEEIETALLDAEDFGCQCEHDCCGHKLGSGHKARQAKNGLWVVIVTGGINV